MNISSNLLIFVILIIDFFIFLFPLTFILPKQFYKNLYQSIPFWVVISYSLLLLPMAFQQVKKAKNHLVIVLFLIYLICLGTSSLFSTNISLSLPILFLNLAYLIIFLASDKVLKSQKSRE